MHVVVVGVVVVVVVAAVVVVVAVVAVVAAAGGVVVVADAVLVLVQLEVQALVVDTTLLAARVRSDGNRSHAIAKTEQRDNKAMTARHLNPKQIISPAGLCSRSYPSSCAS